MTRVTSATPEEQPPRRVVLVTGVSGSGTGALAGALATLGLHVPGPPADPGRAGSPWVADLHDELLRRCHVDAADARPSAWFATGRLTHHEPLRMRVHDWLEEQLRAGGPEIVVADPRLAWFHGLWRSAALRCAAAPAYVVTLPHPAEAAGVQRTASWVNQALHTERATRGAPRALVRHADLLDDWTVPLARIGARFDLAAVQEAAANDIRAVHALLDADRVRPARGPDDVAAPSRLHEIAQESWEALDRLAAADAETGAEAQVVAEADGPADLLARLDDLRSAYAALYEEAEAIAHSTALAARREAAAPTPTAIATETRAGRRGVDRVPHGLRAAVPPGVRRGLRRALGRERGV